MANRELYEVHASIIDANGTYNNLSGYPKLFDSRHYDDDVGKTEQRAYGAFYDALSDMSLIDTRQVQIAYIIRVSTAEQVTKKVISGTAEVE